VVEARQEVTLEVEAVLIPHHVVRAVGQEDREETIVLVPVHAHILAPTPNLVRTLLRLSSNGLGARDPLPGFIPPLHRGELR